MMNKARLMSREETDDRFEDEGENIDRGEGKIENLREIVMGLNH